jgi:hypothetical protein
MKFLQLNSRSINTSQKLIADYGNKHHIDIMCISEAWEIKNISDITKSGFKSIVRPRPDGKHGGVCILFKKNIKLIHRPDLSDPNLELLVCETRHDAQPLFIVSVYIPPGNFHSIDLLDRFIDEKLSDKRFLILGDLNCRALLWESWHRTTPNTNSCSWKMGGKLIDLCSTHNIQILNNGSWTRESNDVRSSPDLSLAKDVNIASWHVDHIYLRSDHFPILVTLPSPSTATTTKLDLRNTDWSIWKSVTHKAFDGFSQDVSSMDPNHLCRVFNNIIQDCISRVIPTKNITIHSKSWMNDELKILLAKAKEARKKFYTRSDKNNLLLYRESVSSFISEYNKAKEANWSDLCASLDPSDPNVWKSIRKLQRGPHTDIVQPLVDSSNNIQFDDPAISAILVETHIHKPIRPGEFDSNHFDLISLETTNLIAEERLNLNSNQLDYNKDINFSEISQSIKKMDSSSAPGPDQILPIMIKKAGHNLARALHFTCQTCWSSGSVPSDWTS